MILNLDQRCVYNRFAIELEPGAALITSIQPVSSNINGKKDLIGSQILFRFKEQLVSTLKLAIARSINGNTAKYIILISLLTN